MLNISAALQERGELERVLFITLLSLPCSLFLLVNGVLLFTLTSKVVFRETPRYVLLYNLLLADTVHLVHAQLMYVLATCRVMLTFPVCGVLVTLASLVNEICPLTLVLMSVERYVAVCFPLRHASLVTLTNTGASICAVWALSFLHVAMRLVFMFDFPFEALDSLQMDMICSSENMMIGSLSDQYNKVYSYMVMTVAAVVIGCSYVGVVLAARSASADKASALKARKTLLLHLVQLCLSLCSMLYSFTTKLLASIILDRATLSRIKTSLYVCIQLLPRCLSALIYGLRDSRIRPILLFYLCCGLKLRVVTAEPLTPNPVCHSGILLS
ncbi:odorant receptor 131-2-like [Thalassophryne amazonica]|uniref:odorant receptor 131-2-like n=1 Tax=Thalassophryne amazonica TaxID=390379 RepID=UPI001472572D|nr:odorant receptor 131-2-like [Thalassophryne amazonica]